MNARLLPHAKNNKHCAIKSLIRGFMEAQFPQNSAYGCGATFSQKAFYVNNDVTLVECGNKLPSLNVIKIAR